MPDKETFVTSSQNQLQSPAISVTKESSSRSQSPAKRLKSEEPPSTTIDSPEPMDEDPVLPSASTEDEEMMDGANETGGVSLAETSTASTSTSTAATASSAPVVSTQATSTVSVTPPPPEEQIAEVEESLKKPSVEGDEWFVISKDWLNRFYAQSLETLPPEKQRALRSEISKDDLGAKVGPIDNSAIVNTELLQELSKRKPGESTSSPPQALGEQTSSPVTAGPVDDAALNWSADTNAPVAPTVNDEAVGGNFVPLKEDLEEASFELVPAETWTHLVSWYGLAPGSQEIKRKVVNTAEPENPNLQVELRPSLLTIYKLRYPSSDVTQNSLKAEEAQSPKKVVVPQNERFQQFLKKLKQTSGVESGRKIRLWKLSKVPMDDDAPSSNSPKKSGKFKQMILDVKDFLALNDSSERQLLDFKDETQNEKYNGHLKVGDAGLVGGAIVVEEQGLDGEWATEIPSKVGKKFGREITLAKHGHKSALSSKSNSRPSSPSKMSAVKKSLNVFTRGRGERRAGRVSGKCGLNNLGNTCYMNSALQCLRSVKELSEYFLAGKYEEELNQDNPLAHNGDVAKQYARLLSSIFSKDCPSSFAPREFKHTIGRYGPSFSGYQQQDSQEFLAFLLDGLHEDLNRIKKKPYIEKPDSTDDMVGNPSKIAELAATHWDIYKQRNDSAVADLFGGLYESTLVCPECGKVSITFDPFMDLTLPLPIEDYWSRVVTFVPRKGKPFNMPVELDKHATFKTLKEYIAKKRGIDDPNKIMGSEVYRQKFFKHYSDDEVVSTEITSNDAPCFFELEQVPTNWPGPPKKKRGAIYSTTSHSDDEEDPEGHVSDTLLIPVMSKYARSDLFGMPFFITVTREEAQSYETILSKVVEKYDTFTTANLWEGSPPGEEGNSEDAAAEGDESSVEHVKAEEPSTKIMDEETDGFVDVSMKDAESMAGSDDAKKPARSSGPRRVPMQTANLFTLKVHSGDPHNEGRVPTCWSHLNANIELASRMAREIPVPNQQRGPAAGSSLEALQKRQTDTFGALTANIGPRSNSPAEITHESGRVTPGSNASDVDDDFYDAENEPNEPTEDTMQVSDEEEANSTALSSGAHEFASGPVAAADFYSSNSNASSRVFTAPSRGETPPPVPESPALIRYGEAIVAEWEHKACDDIFGGDGKEDLQGHALWDDLETISDPELQQRKLQREAKRKQGIHLEDCLDEFAKEETLSEGDTWYCPSCKEHRRATKKFELWKCPDILIIHLKRFSSSRSFRDKIDAMVNCPIELDLSSRVGLKEEGKSQEYELFAVDNHYGGLGGGHYTAYVKNWIDGKWYYCDDTSVRESDVRNVVTPAAYLLFYRRKTSGKPLGGPSYEEIITPELEKQLLPPSSDDEVDASDTAESREASPIPPPAAGNGLLAPSAGNDALWGGSNESSAPPPYSENDPTEPRVAIMDKTAALDEFGDQDNNMQLVTVGPEPQPIDEETATVDVVLSDAEQ